MVKHKGKEGSADNLSGPEKAAIFLLTLGEDFASEVFSRLEEDDIKLSGARCPRSITWTKKTWPPF